MQKRVYMGISLSKLLAPQMVQNSSHKGNLYRFKHKEQCLMSMFWTIHHQIDSGQKVMLVIDEKEDLEKFNYLLSKYGLSELTLIIDSNQKYSAGHLQAKYEGDKKRKQLLSANLADHRATGLKLEEQLSKSTAALDRLHQKQLFPKSVVQINDLVAINKQRRIDTSEQILKPPYSYLDYQAKKATYKKAELLYKEDYKFLQSSNPFNRATILEVENGSLESILQELVDKADKLMGRFSQMENWVMEELEARSKDKFSDIKKEIDKVSSMLMRETELTETQIIKQLFHQKELFASLEIIADPPEDESQLELGFERIKEASEEKLARYFTNVQIEHKRYLQTMTPGNTTYPELGDMIREVNDFTAEMNDLDLFKTKHNKKSIAMAYQKANLQEMKDKLDYALYFIQEQGQYLQWLLFEEQITGEDKKVITYLANQDGFWGQNFENLFLQYFLSHTKTSLDSFQRRMPHIEELIGQFKKSYHTEIVDRVGDASVSLAYDGADNWSSFLSEHSEKIIAAYPLMIVDSTFYKMHSEKLTTDLDNFVFLNEVPSRVTSHGEVRYSCFGYRDSFVINSGIGNIKDLELCNIAEDYFNVNRDIRNLKLSEANNCAKYLGQQLEKLNEEYRIFQTRNLAIISFWSETKNARLVSALDNYGLKEILSDSVKMNLIPGLLSDKDINLFILIEDKIVSDKTDLSIVENCLLLDELRTAGIKVLSLDNHAMIEEANKPLSKILDTLMIENEKAEAVLN